MFLGILSQVQSLCPPIPCHMSGSVGLRVAEAPSVPRGSRCHVRPFRPLPTRASQGLGCRRAAAPWDQDGLGLVGEAL